MTDQQRMAERFEERRPSARAVSYRILGSSTRRALTVADVRRLSSALQLPIPTMQPKLSGNVSAETEQCHTLR